MAGYSGTPLSRKLGLKPGLRVAVIDPPMDYRELVDDLPDGLLFEPKPTAGTGLVHLFATEARVLARELAALRARLRPDAVLWVSWPKKASGRPTDITEDTIRTLALPLGWVDVKVCAVDAVWSGLKLVVRRSER